MKILINNEEVVCSNELTIKEEMLNTSSTILNNCYPKSWETTKDYTQYYYPEDYSKCTISEPQNVDYTIEGSTTQDGTPTPTNPIPIITKTGIITQIINNRQYEFNLGDIELCEIGDYQDYIYKNNSSWYIHKEIGKVVLNGSEETWANKKMANVYGYNVGLDNVKAPSTSGQMPLCYCDYYTKTTPSANWGTTANDSNFTINNSSTSTSTIRFTNGDITNELNNFKTWLSTHNTTVYYVLNTPTNTVITDTNLISQLEAVNENLLFCGVVKRTGNIDLNPRQFHGCNIQILDFKTFLSEGETLDFVIKDKTVLEAIQQVIDAVSDYGIVLGNVNINGANDTIGAYSTADKTAYDVFNYLADITQSRWTTRLLNENEIAVDFYDPDDMPQGTTLEYTQQFFKNKEIVDINYNFSTNDYRNKQVMLSKEVYADITYNETILTDGYAKMYSLENNIYNLVSVIKNGTYLEIATKEEQTLGVEADVYYEAGKNTIEFEDLYVAGTPITVIYRPLVKGRQVIYNDTEVSRIENNIGRKGIIARYENRNDALSSEELLAIGNSYIRYKGSAEITLTVQTKNNDLWNVGQKVSATNIPLEQLNIEYMVKSKQTEMILTTGDIFYTYTLSSSFNSETEINYFDNQRAKASGNIKSGDFIDRNIDIETSTNVIFNNLQITEVQIDGDNVLNSILDSPLIK